MSMIAKNRKNSTWTPLSNEETNNKIFDERRTLIVKWFEKWNHEQRTQVLEDLIQKSKLKQKDFVRDYVKNNIPALRRDFTRHLPRVLSIYIFSFLDPRTLCRCSQVSWHWKSVTEVDQLWIPKCVKLGWTLPFVPSMFETGTWKRNYIENIKALQLLYPKKNTKLDLSKLHVQSKKPPKSAKQPKTMPWRGSDPVPKDTVRFNYLENDDVVEDITKMRKKKSYAHEGKDISHNARSKVKTGQNILNTEVRRSQSYTESTSRRCKSRSDCTYVQAVLGLHHLPKPEYSRRLVSTSQDHYTDMDGFRPYSAMTPDIRLDVPRPPPVHSPPTMRSTKRQNMISNMSNRTPRDPPTIDLFPKQPWTVPDKNNSDEEI